MTLYGSLLALLALLVSALLLAGAGKCALDLLRISFDSALESLLFSLALGAVCLELAVSAGEIFPSVRYGVIAAAAITAALGLAAAPAVFRDLGNIWRTFQSLSGLQRFLASSLLFVLALEGLAALAPVTGSDALHYHFTAQAYFLENGFRANWSLLHGFFCGLGHQLILVGLAFGRDQLATGLIYLGGLTATLATLRLAQQWTAGAWPFATALVFTLTPVAFWQITAAGAPDVWMCAFLPLSVLAILLAERTQSVRACVLGGILAGAIAGTKYTGILMAGALLLAFAIEIRSLKKCLVFFSSAVGVGIWPYLRNWIWTGDPIFPFWFARRPHPAGNLDALHSLLKDTGASNPHPLMRVLHFPFFALSDHGLATWQFLGPLILALGPIALLSVRKTPLWRTVLIVWLIVSLGVGKTSGIPRFLLPVLPIALAASIGGVALLSQQRFHWLRRITIFSLAGFCLVGFAALAAYSWPAWSVALGRVPRESYLREHAPDYERSQFVNAQLAQLSGGDASAKALIFFRHLYYVRVPFVDGDADDSWEMYAASLRSTQAWIDLFARERIRFVVKAPYYPAEFNEPLTRMENDGILKPCASGTVESIQGFRMNGTLAPEPITILCVHP
jgi:Protein of unknown function (DUF1420)